MIRASPSKDEACVLSVENSEMSEYFLFIRTYKNGQFLQMLQKLNFFFLYKPEAFDFKPASGYVLKIRGILVNWNIRSRAR